MDVEVASPFIGVDQNHEQRVSSLKRKLKRKLSCGQSLDQYDCKFGVSKEKIQNLISQIVYRFA